MKERGTSQIAWHLHLCRTAAHWRGGQFAKAHTEFLRLLAQAGRLPVPTFVTIWTDDSTYTRCYERWLAALGLEALPQGLEIRVVGAWDRALPDGFADGDEPAAVRWPQCLERWESEVAHLIDAASLELEDVFPDFPPAWLADYQQTPFCMILAEYPASDAQDCSKS